MTWLGRIKLLLLSVLSAAAVAVGSYFYGREAKRKADENKRNRQLNNDYKKANEVTDAVNKMGDDTLTDAASEWVRNK